MAIHTVTYGELASMHVDDLRKEIFGQRLLVRKMRLGIHLNKEKDTARYRNEKRILARMLTAMQARKKGELKQKPKTSRVPAPSSK